MKEDSQNIITEGRTVSQVAERIAELMLDPTDKYFFPIEDTFRSIRDERHKETPDAVRKYIISSYITRKLVDNARWAAWGWYNKLSDKEQKQFRDVCRLQFIARLDVVLSEPVRIPQFDIEDAIALLKKAGYIAFALPSNEFIDSFFEPHFQYATPLFSGEHESVRIDMQDVDTMQANYEAWIVNAIENVLDNREPDEEQED